MTPVYLNPPPSTFQLVEQKDDQHLELLQSSHRSASSLSCPTFLNSSSTQDQRMQQDIQKCISQARSSELQAYPSSSIHHQSMADNITNRYKQSPCKREAGEGRTCDNGTSAKWMSSKMRLMQKMTKSNDPVTNESVKSEQNFQHQQPDNIEINSINHSNSTIRVCADCNTTTTPLWRSGPRGPKSLCNACGIRRRKARRAMEAAAGNGTIAATTDNSSMKIKMHNKEKKSRTSHVAQYKKQCKTPDSPLHHLSQRKLCFKDFALSLSNNSALKQVFPQDVEEAAILLMELSCGFIQS